MKVTFFRPAGRFPTVVFDPGEAWGELAKDGEIVLTAFCGNFAFWQTLCDDAIGGVIRGPQALVPRIREWALRQLDEEGPAELSARAARTALQDFRRPEIYRVRSRYLQAANDLAAHLEWLNQAQGELRFSVEQGVSVLGLDYNKSSELEAYISRKSLLSKLIAHSLAGFPPGQQLVLFSATSLEDLLTAMISVRILKERDPSIHACLADHGYENFSLKYHLSALKRTGSLTRVFDSVIESKDARDSAIRALASSLQRNEPLRGFLRSRESFPEIPRALAPMARAISPPPTPTFTPEPVLWTRISGRRCYWGKCAFCVQNVKYDADDPASSSEVDAALSRIAARVAGGIRSFIFSDEALSPAVLKRLATGILQSGLEIRWACRAILEKTFTEDLFRLLARSGCYEVLYGLESVSPKVQKLMNKYPRGMEPQRISEILGWMRTAGIGCHINMIAGFPGDRLEDVEETVDFVIENVRDMSSVTYILNCFALFPDTPIFLAPAKFGVSPVVTGNDLTQVYRYRLLPEMEKEAIRVHENITRLRRKLDQQLGWDRSGDSPGARMALALYFGTGHGTIFKSGDSEIFRNPLLEEPRS